MPTNPADEAGQTASLPRNRPVFPARRSGRPRALRRPPAVCEFERCHRTANEAAAGLTRAGPARRDIHGWCFWKRQIEGRFAPQHPDTQRR